MVWDASMHGVPWTPSKMRRAVKVLRAGATVSFAFGGDPLDRLAELDAKVFAARPDLELHVWTTSPSGRIAADELEVLAALVHVRHLKIGGAKGARFDALARLEALESIEVGHSGALDLGFLEPMRALHTVRLHAKLPDLTPIGRLAGLRSLQLAGSIPDLSAVGACKRLEALRLDSLTIHTLDFLARLPKLERLMIDVATVAGSLAGIAQAKALADLSLTNNRGVDDVDFVAELTRLTRLRIDQPHVVTLPDLSKLVRLESVALGGLKAWTNPEALEALPRVKKITLSEINPKLAAERFFFLADSPKLTALEEVDLRFIDFGKRRRAALQAHFASVGQAGRLTPDDAS